MKALVGFLIGVSCFSPLSANQRAYYPPSNPIDHLKNQVNNHDVELRVLQQKTESFQEILENLYEKNEQGKQEASSLEIKLASLENAVKHLAADIKQLQTHANDTGTSLQGMKQKLGEGEQKLLLQNSNIENLQSALQTIIEALQVKTELPHAATGKPYKVKPGDSLEKIAKAHGKTVQAIKDLNGMSSDKIIVGKTLQIPE